MLLSRSAVLLTFVALLSSQVPLSLPAQASIERSAEETAPPDIPAANCRVTLPADGVFEPPSSVSLGPLRTPDRFFFGTEGLWTVLPADGTWRGQATSKRGDFVYDDKFQWFRTRAFTPQDGPLTISGKRLDGSAPSFIETFDAYSFPPKHGYAMTMATISIPAFGCWHITGHYKDQDVTFTIWVTSYTEQEKSLHSFALALRSPPARKVARRVHIDPEVQAKSLVYRVLPEIPPAAQAANASGAVVLHALIGTDGKTHELSYVSGPPLLVQAAIDAVKWWQYRINVASLEPFEAQEVDTTISVLFAPP
jgi:hypothetical protein